MKIKSISRNLGLTIGGLALILIGCGPTPTMEMKKENALKIYEESASEKKPVEGSNYSVTRVAVFKDNLAYNNKRGIYEIRDNKTGKMYLGISGIGISEIGSHTIGKISVSDER